MKCLVRQMKQIAATRHSNDHLWTGPWTLIWSASSWRTAAHSIKCSRKQPQSSSHYLPAQENAWSGEYASAWPTAAKRDFSSSEHCRSTSSICTSHGADSTSTSKGEVKSLKSSLYSILLNNLSLLRCRCLRCRCLRCHGYLASDKHRASDWPLLISAAY